MIPEKFLDPKVFIQSAVARMLECNTVNDGLDVDLFTIHRLELHHCMEFQDVSMIQVLVR